MAIDLILFNGGVYTMEPGARRESAVAISGNRIVATGSDEVLLPLLRSKGRKIDLNGRCVIPGLVDAHVHFQGYALSLEQVDLMDVPTLDQALSILTTSAEPSSHEDWIEGRGWNQSDWPGGQFPTADHLDRILTDQPVLLRHRSGHAAWVNSVAMKIAELGPATADPPGGRIERDEAGRPTGILFEKAINLVSDHIPKPSIKRVREAMVEAQGRCLQLGLTGIHDFDGRICLQALQEIHAVKELCLRVVKNIPLKRLEYALGVGLQSGFGDDWLRIGSVKLFADGALGPRTASLIAPYEGESQNRGLIVTDKEEMIASVRQASRNGISVAIHAIGDKANHDVLDVFEVVQRENRERSVDPTSSSRALHHRIEHAQLLHPDDFSRLAELGIIASMQPIHATSDIEMADKHWGERTGYAYAWRSLLDAGAMLVFGSDAPVESIDPLAGIHAAVTRRRPDGIPGPRGWHPEQRLTVEEAIFAYTAGPAIASGLDMIMGSIAPGKLADLTVLERDIFTIPADEILSVDVAGTIVDGRFMYRNW